MSVGSDTIHHTLILMTTVIVAENADSIGAVVLLWLLHRRVVGPRPLAASARAVLWLGAAIYVRAPAPLVPLSRLFLTPIRQVLALRAERLACARLCRCCDCAASMEFRAQRAFGTFSLVSLDAGSNLWTGDHEGTDGLYHEIPDRVANLPLIERERVLRAEAMAFIREDSVRYLGLCGRRIWLTLRSDTISVVWNEIGIVRSLGTPFRMPLKIICSSWHLILLAAAGAGAIRVLWARDVRREDLFLVAADVEVAAPFVEIVGGNRHHLLLLPVTAIGATAWWLRPVAPRPEAV